MSWGNIMQTWLDTDGREAAQLVENKNADQTCEIAQFFQLGLVS